MLSSYECNGLVASDTLTCEVELVQSLLEQVASQRYRESRTRSGRVLRPAMKFLRMESRCSIYHPSIHRFIHSSTHIHPSIHLSIMHPSIHSSIHPSIQIMNNKVYFIIKFITELKWYNLIKLINCVQLIAIGS
jgi:hypothetical protein